MKKFLLVIFICISPFVNGVWADVTISSNGGIITVHADVLGELATYCNNNQTAKSQIQSAASVIVTGVINANDMNIITNYGNSSTLTNLNLKGAYVDGFANISFSNLQNLASFIFPEGVNSSGEKNTEMKAKLFQNNSKITTLTIPGNYKSLPASALVGMYGLITLKIKKGVVTIGEECFKNNQSLTTVILPAGLTTIGSQAFASCTKLTSVALPEGLTSIPSKLFESTHITSIRLPSTLTTIEADAFSACQWLTSIVIPESVTSIGENAFKQCNRLRDIYCLSKTAPTISDNSFDVANYYMGNGALELGGKTLAVGATVPRTAYWQGSMEKSDYIGEAVLHLPSGMSVEQLSAYTNPARNNIDSGDYSYISPYGDCKWPTQSEKQSNYNSENGWRKFGIVTYTADNENIPIDNIKDDSWYTICFPVNLTKDQIESTFGAGTEVCRFHDVNITEISNGVKTILLDFTEVTFKPSTDPVETVMWADSAYMIHPATASDGTVGFRLIGVAKVSESEISNHTLYGKTIKGYTFKGNYSAEITVPGGWYFLGVKNDVCKYYRQSTTSSNHTRWNQYTACVMPPSDGYAAKSLNVYFIKDEDSVVTGFGEILNNEIVENGKIYDINGRERKGYLPSGLYISNGKKFIIK